MSAWTHADWWPALVVLVFGAACGLVLAWLLRSRHPDEEKPRVSSRRGGGWPMAFLAGFAAAATVGGLIFWAQSQPMAEGRMDSSQAGAQSSGTGSWTDTPFQNVTSASAKAAMDHDHDGKMPEGLKSRLAPLRQRIEASGDDVAARKEAAVLLLRHNMLFQAFEEAEQILARQPDDVDGLYVHGVVRVAMGQGQRAAELFDRVLAQRPDHVAALLGRGKALVKMGNVPMAIVDWQSALDAAGGNHPEAEALLQAAREGAAAEELLQIAGLPIGPKKPVATEGTARPPAAGSFQIRVEAEDGLAVQPGATLFTSLRTSDGEAPYAVKKVPAPQFPLTLTLGPEDTMMGLALPDQGTLVIRLDGDGNASTREDSEPEARAHAVGGSTTTLILKG